MTATDAQATRTLPGSRFPLGATVTATGTNFAVASDVADGMLLCLFDEAGTETQIPIQDCDAGVWNVFVPGAGAGQAYGYRATGPYDPASGVRCHPAKLLLDPYARAVSGTVTFGPEVLGYSGAGQDVPNEADSAPFVPRSIVVADEPFAWHDGGRRAHTYADTIIYEMHVKGFTMRHPGVPPELRGTYAGLGHPAAVARPRRHRGPQRDGSQRHRRRSAGPARRRESRHAHLQAVPVGQAAAHDPVVPRQFPLRGDPRR